MSFDPEFLNNPQYLIYFIGFSITGYLIKENFTLRSEVAMLRGLLIESVVALKETSSAKRIKIADDILEKLTKQ